VKIAQKKLVRENYSLVLVFEKNCSDLVIVEVIETVVIVEVRLSLRIDDYGFCLNKKSNFFWIC